MTKYIFFYSPTVFPYIGTIFLNFKCSNLLKGEGKRVLDGYSVHLEAGLLALFEYKKITFLDKLFPVDRQTQI